MACSYASLPRGAWLCPGRSALPLALGTGTGSELRRPLGITIIGGLIMSQLLTLYTTPVVYLYFDTFQHWWAEPATPRH